MKTKPMLARDYDWSRPITGWLMSEKFDGFRCVWDGTRLVSRDSNEFHAPAWFTDSLPAGVVLDGELFAGRGNFGVVQSIVTKTVPVDAEWRRISFMVFDAPAIPGGFIERLAYLKSLRINGFSKLVKHIKCSGPAHMKRYHEQVIRQDGEGVMLRNPTATYEQKRTWNLIRYKWS